jgi:Zn-dependent protease
VELLIKILILAPPILIAVILHEIAHGLVARWFGDDTAARAGRLTLNPIKHVDPVGTVLLPLLLTLINAPYLFGWAKPVPVNFLNLRNPKRDSVFVALAGPLTNVLLAVLSALVIRVAGAGSPGTSPPLIAIAALMSLQFNVVLAVFNLMPILPLDGGRVLFGLLPREPARAFARLEPYGMLIVMVLLFTGTLNAVLGPVTTFMIRTLL